MVEEIKQEQTTEAAPVVPEAPKTPTAEEQLASANAELARIKAELESKDKGLRTAHQTLTQKDKALKEQTDLRVELAEQKEYLKVLAAIVAENKGTETEGLEPEKKQNLLKVFEAKEAELSKKREVELAKQKQEDYNSKADAIWVKAQTLFAGNDDMLERVEDYLRTGNLERAEKRIAKAEGEKKPVEIPKVENKETEDVRIARLVEEGIARKLKEKYPDILASDDGKPSGGQSSDDKFMERYGQGLETDHKRAKQILDKMMRS
jgi:hypothetical protein